MHRNSSGDGYLLTAALGHKQSFGSLPVQGLLSARSSRRKASWARLIQKVYQVDPLECVNCGSNMRIITLIDDVDVVERILRHLHQWDPQPDTLTPAGPDPPLPQGETLPLTYHLVPDIAWPNV